MSILEVIGQDAPAAFSSTIRYGESFCWTSTGHHHMYFALHMLITFIMGYTCHIPAMFDNHVTLRLGIARFVCPAFDSIAANMLEEGLYIQIFQPMERAKLLF